MVGLLLLYTLGLLSALPLPDAIYTIVLYLSLDSFLFQVAALRRVRLDQPVRREKRYLRLKNLYEWTCRSSGASSIDAGSSIGSMCDDVRIQELP